MNRFLLQDTLEVSFNVKDEVKKMWIRKHQSCHVFCDSFVELSAGKEEICCAKGHPAKILTGRGTPFPSSLLVSHLSLSSLVSPPSLSLSLSLSVWDGNLTVKSSNLLFMTNPIVQSRELGSIVKLWGESANSDGREASVQKGTFSLHVCRISCEHRNTWGLKGLTRSFKETKAWTSNTLGHMFLLDNLCLFTGCVCGRVRYHVMYWIFKLLVPLQSAYVMRTGPFIFL